VYQTCNNTTRWNVSLSTEQLQPTFRGMAGCRRVGLLRRLSAAISTAGNAGLNTLQDKDKTVIVSTSRRLIFTQSSIRPVHYYWDFRHMQVLMTFQDSWCWSVNGVTERSTDERSISVNCDVILSVSVLHISRTILLNWNTSIITHSYVLVTTTNRCNQLLDDHKMLLCFNTLRKCNAAC